jgi:hypothetical protein
VAAVSAPAQPEGHQLLADMKSTVDVRNFTKLSGSLFQAPSQIATPNWAQDALLTSSAGDIPPATFGANEPLPVSSVTFGQRSQTQDQQVRDVGFEFHR